VVLETPKPFHHPSHRTSHFVDWTETADRPEEEDVDDLFA
jgi:hypothetical protein